MFETIEVKNQEQCIYNGSYKTVVILLKSRSMEIDINLFILIPLNLTIIHPFDVMLIFKILDWLKF